MADRSKSRKQPDGHRLSEFIYGTVTGLVAVVGIDVGRVASWTDAALIVVAGAIAIWIAHSYATLMSRRIASGHRIERSELASVFGGSWPVVSAGLMIALPLLGVALGFYEIRTALLGSSAVGVSILALVGAAAGAVTRETWPRRVMLVLLSSALGLAVVAVELVLHH
ncbi:MAG: hypothetical protein AB2L09_08210 [Coriobacteriia bacterium]